MRRLPVALAAAFAAVWLGEGHAGAYCRSSVCPATPTAAAEVCVPSDPADCGTPIYWAQPCVSFDVQQAASNQVDWQTADDTLQQAFNTWLAVECGSGTPSIQISDFGPVVCDAVEYNHDGYEGNANILVFRDDFWPHNGGASVGTDTLALTTVTYDTDTNEILDADIEVNTAENMFTTSGMPPVGDADLLSVLTHETGHFLGLAHTKSPMPATMAPVYPGGISMRTLSADDMAAVCADYPPNRQTNGDDSCIPRHGWASQCGPDQNFGTCAVGRGVERGIPGRSSGGTAPEGSVASALVLLAALGARRVKARSACRGS
jgi:hypothetical protein